MVKAPRYWESRIGRHLRLRDLHILFAVVQWGSMAKAATHLAMSQPAVSAAIASLEDALGVRLLDRSSRGIEPTIYADALLKRGQVAFDELRQGVRDIEFLADPATGDVRVAAAETVAAGLLPTAIDRLSRRYPQIVIRAIVSTPTLEFLELRERRVDMRLSRLPGDFVADDLDVEILFNDPQVIVVGTASRWAGRRKITLAELVNEPWIFPPTPAVGAVIKDAFTARGLEVPPERISVSSIVLRNHLLATGRFLTLLPDSVVRYNAKQWSLKALPIDLGVEPSAVAIVTLKNRTVSPVVQLFIEHVRAAAKMFAPLAKPAPTSP